MCWSGVNGNPPSKARHQSTGPLPAEPDRNGRDETRYLRPLEESIARGITPAEAEHMIDADDREMWTQRLTPIVVNNAVVGFRGTGGNDSGNTSNFIVYVLCYTG